MTDTGIFFGFLLVVVLLFCLTALAKGARTVKQYEKGLITRLGKYHGMAPSGLTFIIPFVDDIMRVDMREQVITVPPQKLITKDNVTVEVDAVVYYKVIDPVKSQFEVQDFGYACTTLAQTNLRNLIGDRTLDETLVARDRYARRRTDNAGRSRNLGDDLGRRRIEIDDRDGIRRRTGRHRIYAVDENGFPVIGGKRKLAAGSRRQQHQHGERKRAHPTHMAMHENLLPLRGSLRPCERAAHPPAFRPS